MTQVKAAEPASAASVRLPLLRRIECVYLPVSDKQRAEAWYVEKGLLKQGPHDPQLADGQGVFLLETHERQTSNFRTHDWDRSDPSFEMFAITFEVEDIEAAHARLAAHDVTVEPIQDNGGCGKGFVFFDPDGNKLCAWQRPGWRRSPLAEIDHVQLPVSDTAEAAAWYRDYLGFQVQQQRGDLVVVRLEQGPTIFLWQTSDATSGSFTRNGEPWPQVGIATQDIEAVHAMAQAQGLRIVLFEDHGCGLVLKFFDPFGNMLVLHQDQEGQRQ
jgi:glyoxylase I family protein